MELVDAVVVLGSIWSLIGGGYVYLTFKARTDTALEEYRQMKISERVQMKPREWWQDCLVNVSSNPQVIDKISQLAPGLNLSQVIQQIIQRKM